VSSTSSHNLSFVASIYLSSLSTLPFQSNFHSQLNTKLPKAGYNNAPYEWKEGSDRWWIEVGCGKGREGMINAINL
jgi:hypothetical protein